jgi:peptidoglycan-associated lipoprotein
MRLKVITAFALVLALAACSSTSNETATSQGAGAQSATRPAGPTPGSQEDLAASVGDRVFFGFDRSELTRESQQVLNQQAAWLKRFPQARVTIQGHADERGTREYNLALGNRRAAAVQRYLVSQGIEAPRVSVISYGKECPRAVGTGEAAWSQNRRAVTGVGAASAGSTCPVSPFL